MHVTYIGIYVNMHVTTTNKRRGHQFEREQGEVEGKGREEL